MGHQKSKLFASLFKPLQASVSIEPSPQPMKWVACIHVCMCAYMHVYMYAYMHVCIYLYMYVCMHVCMYVCMFIYVDM